jgi:hypothetical protein
LQEGAQGRTVNIEVQTLRQILKANKCWQPSKARFGCSRNGELIAAPLPEPASEKTPIFEGDAHQIGNQIGIPQNGTMRKLLN